MSASDLIATGTAACVRKFLDELKPEQSFFIEDVKRADIEFFRTAVKRAGGKMIIKQTRRDVVTQRPGCRVWRIEGSYDKEL